MFRKAIIISVLIFAASVAYAGDFDVLLKELKVEASTDIAGYKTKLALDFGVSGKTVSLLIEKDRMSPEDAYMVLKLSSVTGKSVDAVVSEFNRSKGQGWGKIAKNLGIKPGSAAFHALKERGGGKDKAHKSPKSKARSKGKGKK
jgi:hypothetical protein